MGPVHSHRHRVFTQEDPIGLAGGLNLYGYAAGDPVNFSDPFGLCAQSDSIRIITVDVACGDGSFGTREVAAMRVSGGLANAVVASAKRLQGGSADITPGEVAMWFELLAGADKIYSIPKKSNDGLDVWTGGQTFSLFGIPTYVALRGDVLANLNHPTAAQVLGHEGAHMVDRNKRLGLTHDQIYQIPWSYK